MGVFDGILLLTDYDGTLGMDGKISKENRAAIRHFEENGGLFTVVSGRSPLLLKKWLDDEDIPVNAPLVGFNGAWIIERESEKTLFRGGRTDLAMLDFVEPFWASDPAILIAIAHCAPPHSARCRRDTPHPTFQELKTQVNFPLFNVVLVTQSENDALFLKKRLTEQANGAFEIARSWPTGVEIINPTDAKGVALSRLREMTGARRVIAVGDFENDLPLIAGADVGYAVANAVPALKAIADRETVACGDHAIAAIVAELERGI